MQRRLLFQHAFSAFSLFYLLITSSKVGVNAQTVGACPLETERLDFVGINETCGSASDPHLCTACPLSIVQKIVDGGYSVEEINALPIERCLLENLPQLLEHGATLLALLALQNCDFNSGNLSMDILNSVVFPPPYPGLPTEWLRNGTTSPSSSSSDDGAYSSQDVSKAAGPSSADTQEQEKDASVPMESSAVNSMNSFALLSSVFLLASFVMSDY